MGETILHYESGSVSAGGRSILRELSFTLDRGETLALIGETGSGKTMTALSLMGLLPENVHREQGCIRFCGRELQSKKDFSSLLGREIVYIPQNGLEFLNPARNIRKQLFDALERSGVAGARRESVAGEKLTLVGFEDPEAIMRSYPFELSGGMAQRVTIALSACAEPRLIIADEPTNGLDEKARGEFMALLERLFPEAAKLIITHDITLAALCHRCLVLCGGRCMEYGPSDEVLNAPMQPYTKALIAALVKNGLGETPTLSPEKGECPFYGRCKEAVINCKTTMTRHREGSREWWCKDAPTR